MKNIMNTGFQSQGGVKPSNNVTFRLCELKSNLMFLLRKITNTILRHTEFISASHVTETLKRVQGNKIFKKALAFTLAETLIVMGIIGVVAALTVPNLNSSTGEKEKVAKVKKIYQNLTDAFGRAEAVYGPFDEWLNGLSTEEGKTNRIGQRITEFMKVSKDCGIAEYSSNCIVQGRSGYNYHVLLADGTGMAIRWGASDLEGKGFMVDIDGPNKGKNRDGEGYDQFFFEITNDGIIPEGCDIASTRIKERPTCWVIQMGNMDYLKANNEGKCPNGKVLDWTTNTSCK